MSVARLDVERIRKDFPILERRVGPDSDLPLVYLDSSATSQKPRQVLDALTDFYERHNANIHRGVYTLAEEATAMYEAARVTLAGFIGAPDPATVIFTRGTTESTNLVAHGYARTVLHEGDEILLSVVEHHSNLVPWQFAAQATGARLRFIELAEDGTFDLTGLDGELINARTKLVAITGMSNVLGTLPPLRRLADAAHAVGAAILVDGAQLVPHVPVDVMALDIDFLTISGHKMLGPTASGGLYGRRELLERMDPFLGGGEMIMRVELESSTFKEIPGKFEAGTMNIAQEVGLAAAIDYLTELGMDAVREHEKQITAYAIDRLRGIGAQVFGPTDIEQRGGAVSFWFKDIHPHDLAQVLDTDGVCIRAGHHCAQPLMRVLGVPATARASFYVYNTEDEVDALIASLRRAEAFLALEELYKEVILDHYKNPRNKRDLPDAERSCSKNNPLCGDEITVKAHVEDRRVAAIAFLGSGCSISQASASMMTEAVAGRSVDEALGLAGEFRAFMEGTIEPDEATFGDMVALQGVVKYPVRIKCAVLAWDVLQDALSDGAEASGGVAHSLPS